MPWGSWLFLTRPQALIKCLPVFRRSLWNAGVAVDEVVPALQVQERTVVVVAELMHAVPCPFHQALTQ